MTSKPLGHRKVRIMRNIFIASLIAVVATQAPAQGIPHYATVPVSNSDVANGDASDGLRHRIANAIERVCGSGQDVVNLQQFADISRCRRAARADADRQLTKLNTRNTLAARKR